MFCNKQVPFSDGLYSLPAIALQMGPLWALKLVGNAIKDIVRNYVGLSRHYIPVIEARLTPSTVPIPKGAENAVGILATPECKRYWEIIPSEGRRLGGWQNKVPATIALTFPLYRPVGYAKDVVAPTLGIYATEDSLCPVAGVKKMFALLSGPTETHELRGGHFEAYSDEFEKVIRLETQFLLKQLNP